MTIVCALIAYAAAAFFLLISRRAEDDAEGWALRIIGSVFLASALVITERAL